MEIEVRGATTALNDYMCEYAQRILENSAAMYGCTCQIKLMGATESLTSDRDLAERIAAVCSEKLGLVIDENIMTRSGGSEDFAYMMNRVQNQGGKAVFFRVCAPMAGAAHNRRYSFGEEVLVKGVKTFCGMAYDLLG